ncbi:DNA primase [Patescibacteria group bacterium]|nr:DNA primase [Patescibacteria group bacterium]MBU1123782.1 DNA primase [Patescibacteria group bacterium]MBU1910916.1 DNA primase [Patescibacteria group bacterium]
MDSVFEIKSRLPIEELVGQYCQLKKKGRNFVTLCPFHNDTKPSMQVSPDKGIAYCFVCQTGGDIFSFYQAIENTDFKQALVDLAEKTGVTIEHVSRGTPVDKDEKERARECLKVAESFYMKQLKENKNAQEYIKGRDIDPKLLEKFSVGYAPDSFSDTYQYLLKKDFSKKEILSAGMGVQKDLAEGRIYDRFRNRIMFPIQDHRGDTVGFGGRTIGEDDAKYLNSSEGPLYNKSNILYGLNHAKEAMRETKSVILVEGYFDVLACHQVGVTNVVAASGTALTQQHAKMLKRHAEKVILCLDQDQAGREAAERSFCLCAKEGMQINVVKLDQKDPDEAAHANSDDFKKQLTDGGVPYMDMVLSQIAELDLTSAEGKKKGLQRLMPLLDSLSTSVEKEHELNRAASALSTTVSALGEDLEKYIKQNILAPTQQISVMSVKKSDETTKSDIFSRVEVALGLLLLYPQMRDYLKELIAPDSGFPKALYDAIENIPEDIKEVTLDMLDLPEEDRERMAILQLYCEHHVFDDWSDNVAARELKGNIARANKDIIRAKQKEITAKLLEAQRSGKTTDVAQLMNQYQQVLKLAKKAS